MAYTHITWGELKTTLAQRLADTGNVYWEDGELGLYLAEALRTWSLLTGFWRDTGVLTTTANTPFYNLTTLQNGSGEDLLSHTVTDQEILTLIQYHLLEPATGNSWTGSEQFTLADVTAAMQRRRDQILADTGCVVTRVSGVAVAPNNPRLTLSDNVINLRRVAFVDASDDSVYPLIPADVAGQRNYSALSFYTPGEPYSYSLASVRPTEILMIPPPSQPGTLDYVAVTSGAELDPAAGVLLGLPDDYAFAVKWGAMADLLAKDGPARDAIRSSFCERRYALAVQLIRIAPVVVNAEINGIPLDTDSLTNMDSYNSSWQTDTDTPDAIASIRTLVALSPCPDDVYSTTFDVVRKAPIPDGIIDQDTSDDAEYVQLGREQLDAIIDYAEHLAAFKMGGEEFRATMKGAENFFTAAVNYNQRLSAHTTNIMALMAQSSSDFFDRPYMNPGGLGALQGKPLSGGSATIDKQEAPSPGQGGLE